MFGDRRGKRLPHFRSYLKRTYARHDQESGSGAILGCVLVPLAMIGVALVAAQFLPGILAVMAGIFGGFVVGGVLAALIWKAVSRPKGAAERRRRDMVAALGTYRQAAERGRLHKELDPTAAQLLEAAAFYWEQITGLLDRPPWVGETARQYAAIREQALTAANEAMLEASVLCAPCLGKPARDRKDQLKEALQDLADWEIMDALEGFRQVARAESSSDAHVSPHIRVVFEPVRQYAEKLKALHAELEELSARLVSTSSPSHQPALAAGASTIDLVLNEIRLVRRAEAELDDEHLHGQA